MKRKKQSKSYSAPALEKGLDILDPNNKDNLRNESSYYLRIGGKKLI